MISLTPMPSYDHTPGYDTYLSRCHSPHGPLCDAVRVSYAMREAARGPAPSAASDKQGGYRRRRLQSVSGYICIHVMGSLLEIGVLETLVRAAVLRY
eukprot:COSAG01_NODE_2093_length_8443_cov_351.385307_4_plen_97_part_00